MLGGQKAAAPESVVEWLVIRATTAKGSHHHKGRQVLVFAAETVAQPRAHARIAGDLATCLEKGDRRIVVNRLGVHGFDEAEFIGDAGNVRHEFADGGAAFAMLGELEDAGCDREIFLLGGHASEALALSDRVGQILAKHFLHLWLGIEQIHLRGRAGLEQIDHALRLDGQMREAADDAGRAGGLQEIR